MTEPGSHKRRPRRPRTAAKAPQVPWSQLQLRYDPIEILSIDQIHAIHETALTILEEVGMRVLEPNARGYLATAGCKIDEGTMQARFDRAMVEELIARAPAEFSLTSRNPERNLQLGGRNSVFSSVGGPAFCSDLDRGRRSGTYAEMCDYIKLVQSLNVIHQEGGGGVEALGRPAATRHLDL
ncbi:MAG: trimethylamine methyltransferase family protein, partial [Deltaproteobacteria bacterium]|nr:trimethylamine methyltransferase family protein [Deltaproteobacteria bacterium]